MGDDGSEVIVREGGSWGCYVRLGHCVMGA
jgi:hypothetical protein